jgi:putative tryptophan/tyrosine transport system substrate-binding protein
MPWLFGSSCWQRFAITMLHGGERNAFMNRREFLTAIGGSVYALDARAQPSGQVRRIEKQAKMMGLSVLSLKLTAATHDFDQVFKDLMSKGADMALFLSSPSFAVQSPHIGELAARTPLPTMFIFRGYVASGGLVSYGAEASDIYRQAAAQVAKILRGAKPAELPVEQPKRFELTVNLKTAKSIGIEIPTSLLLRADEVIE